MVQKRKNMTVGELLKTLSNLDTVEQQIRRHSVGLVRIPLASEGGMPDILGSGTFVEINGKYGILTASHLIPDLLEQASEFGLCILPTEHRFTVKSSSVDILEVAKPTEVSQRPDLAYILLLGPELESLLTAKSFWNLTHWQESHALEPIDTEHTLWGVSGFPAENTVVQEGSGQFSIVKCFQNLCGYSGIEYEYSHGGFDYLEVSALYLPGSGLPLSFKGMSGGGLWQMTIAEGENGAPRATDPVLWGVACWETNPRDPKEGRWAHTQATEEKWIVCHGPRGIYQKLLEMVERKYSR